MTMSPYDNLPVGKDRQHEENLSYEDVSLEVPDNSGSPKPDNVQLPDIEEVPEQTEDLQYVDVPVGETSSEIMLPDIPESADETFHNSDAAAPVKTVPMDCIPRYSDITLKNICGTHHYNLPFEETLLVPDTMPDMESILFTEGSMTSSRPTGSQYEKNDNVSGEISLFTVYKPAADNTAPVDVVKSSVSFRTAKCWEASDADTFRVISMTAKELSAEMINERKFKVKGIVCICYADIYNKDLLLFKGTDDCDLIQKTQTIYATDLVFETGDITEIAQEVDLHEDQPTPVKILKETFNIIENHKQITSGKLVINGTVITSILYLGQDENSDDTRLCSMINKTDFTQFIVIDDDTDAEMTQISFIGDNLAVSIETKRQIIIKGQIITSVYCYENKLLSMVSDAYHKKRDLRFDITRQPVSLVSDTVTGEISSREVINIGDDRKKPSTFLCGYSEISDISGSANNGKIIIEGSIAIKILALDEDNVPVVIEADMPLRGSLDTSETSMEPDVSICASIKEFWFDSINSRQMEINAGVGLDVWVFSQNTFVTLENLCFADTEAPSRHIPMAIYITDAGDTLWDIAKRYKSDTSTLARLNQLDEDDAVPEGTRLFIMKQA